MLFGLKFHLYGGGEDRPASQDHGNYPIPCGNVFSPRHAVNPVNALLNVAFSVTTGRLAAYLAARGASPAIGFLHSDKPGRWSLVYDVIEPLRPLIERHVFGFIGRHQFGSNDFIRANDGSIRLADNLLRVVIAETALGGRILDAAVNWIIGLISAAPNACVLPGNDRSLQSPKSKV